jgi:hypothetical protein
VKRTSSDRTTPRDPFDQGRGTWAGGWILVGAILLGAGVLAAVALLIIGEMGR